MYLTRFMNYIIYNVNESIIFKCLFFLSKGGLSHYYSFWLKFNLFFLFLIITCHLLPSICPQRLHFDKLVHFISWYILDMTVTVKLFVFIVFICVQYDKFYNSSKNQKSILHYIYICNILEILFAFIKNITTSPCIWLANIFFFMTESLIFPPF